MKYKSFAKINLCLDVVRKREDGYHELDMIMVPIDLFDTVDIKFSDKMQMKTNKGYLPIDDRNTVIKAINLLRDKYHFKENFSINLMKNIPTQGGMGGGSSNAATTIKMIDKMLDLKMSEKEMLKIGEQVGADVPFCLYGRPALVKGFGEILKPIEVNLEFYVFIVKPKWGVSTPKAFRNLDLSNLYHPDTKSVVKALNKNDYNLFIENVGNTLEDGAFKLVPQIKKIKKELIDFGFDTAIMSGSGSTVFAITKDENLIDMAVLYFVNKYALVKKSRIIKDVRLEEDISFF